MKKFWKHKQKSAAIALVLLMASVMVTLYTPAQAQDGEIEVETTAYLSFRPNPVGVGQTILVNIWTTPATHRGRYQSDYKVTITDPDGNEDVITMDSYHGDATAWFEYVVDQVGTWTLQFEYPGKHFPEENVTGGFFEPPLVLLPPAYYMPSSTAEQELVVQEEPVFSWPPSPLPTDYWTRPVSPENREWVSILGDYPYTGYMHDPPPDTNPYASNYRFTPYVQGPTSAHVVWKRLGALSGLMGGDMGQLTYGWGEGTYAGTPNIIFEGRCYQSVTKAGAGSSQTVYWQCCDLRTGEVYWEYPAVITGVSFFGVSTATPSVISYVRGFEVVPGATQSQVGTGASLVGITGGRLIKWHPYSGHVTLNVTAMSGTFYMDPYVLSVENLGGGNYRLINWTTAGSTSTFANRVISNVSWPFSSLGVCDYEAGVSVSAGPVTPPGLGAWYGSRIRAASLKTGALLWDITDTDTIYSSSTGVADHGKFAVCMMDRHWNCYDLYSGTKVWESELTGYPWGWAWGYTVASAYGLIYGLAYDGVYAFDWDDGSIAWQFSAGDAGYETPYGTWSWMSRPQIADGKVYVGNGEHSPTAPLTRGWRLFCINATSGEGIWNITGGMTSGAMADGYLTADNRYDGYMYVFGRGKSATTVTTPKTEIPLGESVVIEGTVLDMSPAQPGTPCVSKESMAGWMEYLHMQKPIPADVTGVPVSLDTLDPNGNFIHIGDVTTDGYSGTFGFMWTPEVPGTYAVTATFMGDDSYGSSFAQTYVGVGEAPEPPPEYGTPEWPAYPEPEKPADYTPMFLGIIVAVAVAIVIGIISLLDHRRLR